MIYRNGNNETYFTRFSRFVYSFLEIKISASSSQSNCLRLCLVGQNPVLPPGMFLEGQKVFVDNGLEGFAVYNLKLIILT